MFITRDFSYFTKVCRKHLFPLGPNLGQFSLLPNSAFIHPIRLAVALNKCQSLTLRTLPYLRTLAVVLCCWVRVFLPWAMLPFREQQNFFQTANWRIQTNQTLCVRSSKPLLGKIGARFLFTNYPREEAGRQNNVSSCQWETPAP